MILYIRYYTIVSVTKHEIKRIQTHPLLNNLLLCMLRKYGCIIKGYYIIVSVKKHEIKGILSHPVFRKMCSNIYYGSMVA